jgi:hypothetical protein
LTVVLTPHGQPQRIPFVLRDITGSTKTAELIARVALPANNVNGPLHGDSITTSFQPAQ